MDKKLPKGLARAIMREILRDSLSFKVSDFICKKIDYTDSIIALICKVQTGILEKENKELDEIIKNNVSKFRLGMQIERIFECYKIIFIDSEIEYWKNIFDKSDNIAQNFARIEIERLEKIKKEIIK